MKKITKNEAVQLIQKGLFPVCQTSYRGDFVFVNSLSELDRLESISQYQLFVLWGYEESEIQSFELEKTAMELTIDEATELLLSNSPIYIKTIVKKDVDEFVGRRQLQDLLRLYRKYDLQHIPFRLYWNVE